METSKEKETILLSCELALAVCSLKGMALCLLRDLFEEEILTDDIAVILSGYFETDGTFLDSDDTIDVIEEAEEIFKSEHSHSAWLRKAQLFRKCLKKFETMLADFSEMDTNIEDLEEDEE